MADDLRQSQIPWARRDKVGRIRGYLQTVSLVTFRWKRFAMEMVRPVDYTFARSFRWTTVGLMTFLALLLSSVAFLIEHRGVFFGDWLTTCALPSLTLGGVLAATSGVTTLFCSPRRLDVAHQNRAIALSLYLQAPLVYLLVPAVLAILAQLGLRLPPSLSVDIVITATVILACTASVIVFLTILSTFMAVARLTQRDGLGTLWLLVMMPLAWVFLTLLAVGLPLAAAVYWTLMAFSLTS